LLPLLFRALLYGVLKLRATERVFAGSFRQEERNMRNSLRRKNPKRLPGFDSGESI
jgi:hypothetical protein